MFSPFVPLQMPPEVLALPLSLRITAASSPVNSWTTHFDFDVKIKFQNIKWTLRCILSLCTLLHSCLSVLFCSRHSLTMICTRPLDRTSETCKYLKDFSERSISYRCMYQSRDECLAGCCCHRTAVWARQSKSRLFPWVAWWPWDVKNATLQWNAIKLKSVWM